MKKTIFNQQSLLLGFILIFFILSASYLLAVGSKFNTLDFGHDWWTVYFGNPKNNSLDFTIENHNNNTNFHWIVLDSNGKIKEGDIKIASGQSAIIQSPISGLSADDDLRNKKITIEVSTGDNDKKDIYKNF